MQSYVYLAGRERRRRGPSHRRKRLMFVITALLLIAVGFWSYKNFLAPATPSQAADRLQFDSSVSQAEKQKIQNAIRSQSKTYRGSVGARVDTTLTLDVAVSRSVLSSYVPVADVYATRQAITKDELSKLDMYVPDGVDATARAAIAKALGVGAEKLVTLTGPVEEMADSAVAFVPVEELSPQLKLLTFDGAYYLDTFSSGAVFRTATFNGGGAGDLRALKLNDYPSKDTTLKVNMTGVTALTRDMMKKLDAVKTSTYFSEKIGPFLADADITHVSNEVSFKPGCAYSTAVFCAPPAMIDALKASGVDLVELTGNHNNDTGSQYDTDTINLYHSLGWHTFGGGLDSTEAAKPYVADMKGSKVAFIGYNYADGPNSGEIATSMISGSNGFDFGKVESDIVAAKRQGEFAIVDIQFWECYAYPDGFVEFPECDLPIGQQESVFRKVIDMGADMVIGTQAHQPQTYEIYKGKPIYYGLGNLYFEQTRWPGTERGMILTHYFVGGKLIQTRLSPTVYDSALQTHLMDAADTQYFLQRLQTARQTAGL